MGTPRIPNWLPRSFTAVPALQVLPQQQNLQGTSGHQCSHSLLVSWLPLRGHQLFNPGLLQHCTDHAVLRPEVLP